MIPDFAGARIARVQVENMLRLWTESGWQFNLEGDVHLHAPRQLSAILDTSSATTHLPDGLEPLVGATILAVTVAENGDLTIRLDRTQLAVAAEKSYEAWQIHGPNGEIVVCMPGGELAIWGPSS